jgi:hypothetical protein
LNAFRKKVCAALGRDCRLGEADGIVYSTLRASSRRFSDSFMLNVELYMVVVGCYAAVGRVFLRASWDGVRGLERGSVYGMRLLVVRPGAPLHDAAPDAQACILTTL